MPRPQPEALAVDGYIRVSRVHRRRGPRFISPTVQREQMSLWARACGVTVLHFVEELDQSGARVDRPGLEAAIQRVEGHLTQGLVVWKVDRFFRVSLEGQMAIRRIMAAEGTFFSVLDGLDSRTDTGRHMLRITLSNAELEMDRFRDGWDRAHASAVARGAYPCSTTPVGYRKTRHGKLRLDPKTAPIIAEVFQRRAAGASVPQLSVWLSGQGVLTARGNPGWSYQSTAELFRNRAYLGEVHWGAYHNESAHAPLADPATWERAQRPRADTLHWCRRPSLLVSFVRCASCCCACSPQDREASGRKYRLYACHGRSASGRCPRIASIDLDRLDAYVTEAAFELLRRRRRPALSRLVAAEQAEGRAQAALAAYRDSPRLLAVLGDETFAEGLRVRMASVREARLALAAERARRAQHDLPGVAELRRAWPSMDLEARRAVIGKVIDFVFVAPGREDPIEDRVTICPTGTAPAKMPRSGDKGGNARPFTGRLKQPRARSRRA